MDDRRGLPRRSFEPAATGTFLPHHPSRRGWRRPSPCPVSLIEPGRSLKRETRHDLLVAGLGPDVHVSSTHPGVVGVALGQPGSGWQRATRFGRGERHQQLVRIAGIDRIAARSPRVSWGEADRCQPGRLRARGCRRVPADVRLQRKYVAWLALTGRSPALISRPRSALLQLFKRAALRRPNPASGVR